MPNELKLSSKVPRLFLLGVVVLGVIVVAAAGFSYLGGNDRASASGKNANDLDRRAPAQQREFARIVDGYFARKKELSKELEAIRGNPIKEDNFNSQWDAADAKLLADLAALMRKSGGRFEDWVGTLEFNIVTPSEKPPKVHIVFGPDGIQDRYVSPDQPTRYSQTALILFEAGSYETVGAKYVGGDGDTRPFLSSPLGQMLGTIDVKRKVKVSGTLVMQESVPSPRTFLTSKYHKPSSFASSDGINLFGTGGASTIIVSFSAISNL